MTFLLGKWGKKTKLLFLCTDFGKKKSISIFLKATYAKNICFEKNKTKLSGRESRTTLLCHDGKLFSHDCWLLPLAIIKKYTLKKTPNTKPKAWEYFKEYDLSNSLKQPFQIITDCHHVVTLCCLLGGLEMRQFLAVQASLNCSKDGHLHSIPSTPWTNKARNYVPFIPSVVLDIIIQQQGNVMSTIFRAGKLPVLLDYGFNSFLCSAGFAQQWLSTLWRASGTGRFAINKRWYKKGKENNNFLKVVHITRYIL